VEIGDLPVCLEPLERVRLGDGEIDTAQVEQIVEIGGNATGYDRQHAHVVAVLSDSSHPPNKFEGGASAASGGRPHRPDAAALLPLQFGIAALKSLRYLLRRGRPRPESECRYYGKCCDPEAAHVPPPTRQRLLQVTFTNTTWHLFVSFEGHLQRRLPLFRDARPPNARGCSTSIIPATERVHLQDGESLRK